MSDHHYHYEVRNQDPVRYIDRVPLAELVARDAVRARTHLKRLKAASLTALILLGLLIAQYVPVSQGSTGRAQEVEVRDADHLLLLP